jgi:hypothetical protein
MDEQLDDRLVWLQRAAARVALLEAGELSPEEAFEEMFEVSTFELACERADAAARKQPVDRKIEWLRRLLDTDMSLDQLYDALNRNRPTSEVTVEAIKIAVRARGIDALKEPATRERLARCDKREIAEIDRWLSKNGIAR